MKLSPDEKHLAMSIGGPEMTLWDLANFFAQRFAVAQENRPGENFDLAAGLPMCTGPYKLASTSPTEVTWTRDDNWWGVDAGFKLPDAQR